MTKQKITKYTVTISQHFLCALVNNDYSGMALDEVELLDEYLLQNNYGHVIMPDNIPETNFAQCEITKLYSNCVDVKFYLK